MDEDIWREIFENEMQDKEIYDLWEFSVDENFQAQKGWLQYSLCCFASFCCSICGRKWASSKVHLIFYMKLISFLGQVKMNIFRQKCKVCKCAEYEEPIFIVENVEIAMKCLVTKICQKFYQLSIEDFPKNFVNNGRQDGVHDRDNCEACSKGICNYIKCQENKSKQQKHAFPENKHTTYNTASQHQQSRQYIQEDIRSNRILIPHSQHLKTSGYSRQDVRSHTIVPQHEQDISESQCCCVIL